MSETNVCFTTVEQLKLYTLLLCFLTLFIKFQFVFS